MIDATDIKRMVPMDTVLGWYGLTPNRSGFLACPFHEDKDPSFKVYPGDRGWHCFSCDTGGSVIDLVMRMEGMTFQDACQAIVERAGLTGYKSAFRKHVTRDYAKRFKKTKETKKQEESLYWLGKVRRYNQIMAHATEWTPELEEACQNHAYAEYRLEAAQGLYDE